MPVILAAAETLPTRTDDLVPWTWSPIVIAVGIAVAITVVTALIAWRHHRWLVIETPGVTAAGSDNVVEPTDAPARTSNPAAESDRAPSREPAKRGNVPGRDVVAADRAA